MTESFPEHNQCEDYSQQPGVIYHAFDVPRCPADGVRWFGGRWLCERHAMDRGSNGTS